MKKRELTEFGKAVKKRLIEIRETQIDLAAYLDIEPSYLNAMIHGFRPGYDYIEPICKYLGIEMPS